MNYDAPHNSRIELTLMYKNIFVNYLTLEGLDRRKFAK